MKRLNVVVYPTLVGALALVVAAAGCGTDSDSADESTRTESSGIRGGMVDSGHPAVGILTAQNEFCSGTLIAPDVVLTAAHCTRSQNTAFYLGTGQPNQNPSSTMQRHGVRDQMTHPSFQDFNGGSGCPDSGFDIGLVLLDAPVTNVTPMKIARNAVPATQEQCDEVGFGMTEQNSAGQKRKATATVIDVENTWVKVQKGTGIADHGDSGGPLLCNDVIVGTTSCGQDDTPTHTQGFFGRIDPQAKWIDDQINRWHSGGGSSSSGGGGGDSCSHDPCTTGAPIAGSCHPCVERVCENDPSCCTASWSQRCVTEIEQVCFVRCQ